MGEVLVYAIGDGAVVVQRSEHLTDGVQDVVDAVDVEEGLLLTCEGSIRQVFCGGRGAYGETAFAFRNELVIVGAYFGVQAVRQWSFHDPTADGATRFRQCRYVIYVQRG